MRIRKKAMIPFVLGCVLLSGCSNGFTDEVKKNEMKNQEIQKEKKQKEDAKNKAQTDFYKGKEKPLNEVVKENDLDTVKVMSTIDYVEQDQYQDANEFAKYVAHMLYGYYTLQVSPEQYYSFLQKYGSDASLKKLPTEKDALTVIASVQDMFKKQNITGESYVLTEVTFNRMKNEGMFYRKVLTTNGEQYFATTIVKENGQWKFDEDGPAPPFIEAK
jgi:hypothetical protein